MATSPQTQHQTTASWVAPSNQLDTRPFEATDGAEVDNAPSTLQSRPFSSPSDQSVGSPDIQTRLDENQQTDKLFDLTQVDLFAGAAPSEPPPTTLSVQRSDSSDSSDTELEGDRPDESEHPIQRKGGAFASGDDGEDKPGDAIQAKLTLGQVGDRPSFHCILHLKR